MFFLSVRGCLAESMTHQDSQHPVTPDPGDLSPSCGPDGHLLTYGYTHTHTQLKQNILKSILNNCITQEILRDVNTVAEGCQLKKEKHPETMPGDEEKSD